MNTSKWIEFNGAPPSNIANIPRGEVGLGNDGNWWAQHGEKVYFMPAARGSLTKVGAGAASSGAATVITAAQADTACTCNTGPTDDGFVSADPPPDVMAVLDPQGLGAGALQGGPVFAQFKTGAEAEIWRFSNPESFAQCQCVDPSLIPNGPTASGTPSTMQSAAGAWAKLSTGAKVAVVAAGAALVGGGIWYGMKHMKKHGRRSR